MRFYRQQATSCTGLRSFSVRHNVPHYKPRVGSSLCGAAQWRTLSIWWNLRHFWNLKNIWNFKLRGVERLLYGGRYYPDNWWIICLALATGVSCCLNRYVVPSVVIHYGVGCLGILHPMASVMVLLYALPVGISHPILHIMLLGISVPSFRGCALWCRVSYGPVMF